MTSSNPPHVVSVHFIDPLEEMLQTPMQERIMQKVTNGGSFYYPPIGGSDDDALQASLAQREYLTTRNMQWLDERDTYLERSNAAMLRALYREIFCYDPIDGTQSHPHHSMRTSTIHLWQVPPTYYTIAASETDTPLFKNEFIKWVTPIDKPNRDVLKDSESKE